MKKSLLPFFFLLLASCSGCSSDSGDFTFIVASDLHYLSPTLHDDGTYFYEVNELGDGKELAYSEPILDAFLADVKRKKPDFLFLTGDLTFNGEKASHEEFSAKLHELEKSGVQVLTLPGNHDINKESYSYSGDERQKTESVSEEEFASLYQDFGRSEATSKDESGDSLSYLYPLKGKFDALVFDVNGAYYQAATRPTLNYIEDTLKSEKRKGRRVISLSHQTALWHTQSNTAIQSALQYPDDLRQAGCKLSLAGHVHIQDILEEDGLTEILSGALSVNPIQYGVASVKNGFMSYHTERVDMKKYADENGLSDPVYQDFASYSSAFFRRTNGKGIQKSVDASSASDEEKKEMVEVGQEMDEVLFAGDFTHLDKDRCETAIPLFETYAPGWANYLKRIYAKIGLDYTKLELKLD